MDLIQSPISPEPVTGHKRIGVHEMFSIAGDLQMIQQVRVVRTNDAGVPLVKLIAEDPTLSNEKKALMMGIYGDQIVTRQTRGAFVDPATGSIVPEGTEGAISQLRFFRGLTMGKLKAMGVQIDDDTSLLELFYVMIDKEIPQIDARGDL